MIKEDVYVARQLDYEGKAHVDGPGNGFGHYAGTLWPDSRFADFERAQAAAKLCNEAYRQGQEQVRAEMRQLLGIKS